MASARRVALRDGLISEDLPSKEAETWVAAWMREGSGDPPTAEFIGEGLRWVDAQIAGGRRVPAKGLWDRHERVDGIDSSR